MIKDLVPKSDPVLRTPCEKFNFEAPQMNPVDLYKDLSETLIHHKGYGLAANQIGYPYRAFVVWTDPIKIFINPYIVDVSEKTVEMEEACLSFPGICVKVKRHQVVKIRYADPTGKVQTDKFQDLTARVIQHEMEHLDGKLFTQNVSRFQVERAIKKSKRNYVIGELI
jgi:peptide deformylase